MLKKAAMVLIIFAMLGGLLIFAGLKLFKSQNSKEAPASIERPFIVDTYSIPQIEGNNVVTSGVFGKIVLSDENNKPYEASLDIYKKGESRPFISVRSNDMGEIQIPLRSGDYVLKPLDPNGPDYPSPGRETYEFSLSDGRWLQVQIEFK